MTQEEWLTNFDESKDNFKWFFDEYFKPEVWLQLILLREDKNVVRMMDIMNNVWFILPDGKFNIMVNPKGWNDFLYLIEEPPDPYDDPSTNDNLEQS